jgi:hypothetical protein
LPFFKFFEFQLPVEQFFVFEQPVIVIMFKFFFVLGDTSYFAADRLFQRAERVVKFIKFIVSVVF